MQKYILLYIYSIIICFGFGKLQAQDIDPLLSDDAEAQRIWVDKTYRNMTVKEKIGQLFMVAASSSDPAKKQQLIKELITKNHIGGLIFMKGTPMLQAKLTNKYQALSKIPLLIAQDAEWGLAMRLDSTYAFPWNMTLGAIQNDSLIKRTGEHIAKHCKRMGVHFNFGPVVDINTNPLNPIIGNRSFGEDKKNVANKAFAFMEGLHKEGVLSCAKHFPGHGDTAQDSHKTLPTISFNEKRINTVELYPYKKMIPGGLSSVMVAHLNIPSLESRENYPSSVSENIVTDLLKEKLKFKGLIFTDALNMKGAANFKEPGEIDLAAFMAGNDILLIPEDVPKAMQKLIAAQYSGDLTEERLALSVKKILKAKYKMGLNEYEPIDTKNLLKDLNTAEDDALQATLIENSLTVLRNEGGVLPVKNLELKKIAYVPLGDALGLPFYKELNKYAQVDQVTDNSLIGLLKKLENYNYVIIGFHKSSAHPWKSYKFEEKELVWLYEIARKNRTVLNIFTKPYALSDVKTFKNFEGVLVAYQNTIMAQEKAAQLIFGAFDAKGKLPVSTGENFKEGAGIDIPAINRLSYGYPEQVGVISSKLSAIDSIMTYTLNKKMTPGAQVLIARKGKVIYHKNFGYYDYSKSQKVTNNTIYDLASLTKILSTLPLVMELQEKGVLGFETTVAELLPDFKDSNKADLTMKEMLSHFARLHAWIPFYKKTMDSINGGLNSKYYRKKSTPKFSVKVANELYFRNDMRDSLMTIIKESELRPRRGYKYSDLAYYMLKEFIETYYHDTLDKLTQEHFYKSLGATSMGYLPLNRFDEKWIVASENDVDFRNQVIKGFVHDQGAALFGGVGGHAGLFSNANDVAKMMQLYLNKGVYGGKKYFKPETVDAFNTCYYCDQKVRRGVGFDKPQLGESGPTCGCVSMTSFGHSGFTGTYTWADPDEELIYIFLSNRTFPDANNRGLIRENIRTKIQSKIYEALAP